MFIRLPATIGGKALAAPAVLGGTKSAVFIL